MKISKSLILGVTISAMAVLGIVTYICIKPNEAPKLAGIVTKSENSQSKAYINMLSGESVKGLASNSECIVLWNVVKKKILQEI